MNHFRQISLLAILTAVVGLNFNTSRAWATDSCIAHSVSLHLQGRFTPEGAWAKETRLKLEKALNRAPLLQMEVQPGRPMIEYPGKHSTIAVIYESGTKLGSLDYYIDRDVLIINRMTVDSNHRRIGLGSTLFEEVIRLNPQIKQIRTVLAEDNDSVLYAAINRGKNVEAAILETPAYKIRARLGFTRIVPGSVRDVSWDGSGPYQFAVERP
ncbi:MAG: GNAT family N-acetyltransferase [Bdellovibrionia bacterium]